MDGQSTVIFTELLIEQKADLLRIMVEKMMLVNVMEAKPQENNLIFIALSFDI